MSEKKLNTRWREGAQRYSPKEAAALAKLREEPGWRNGARVVKRAT